MPLGQRDKSVTDWGGYAFHHTDPQRRVSCILGTMLVPRSADDIAPIAPEALASVQAALNLLADLIDDRDHNLFLAESEERMQRNRAEAASIRHASEALASILRVTAPATGMQVEIPDELVEAIRKYVAIPNSPEHRLAALNGVAYIGERVAALVTARSV